MVISTESSIQLLKDADGQIECVVAIVRDVNGTVSSERRICAPS